LVVDAADAWFVDLHAPATQGDLACLLAVPIRAALRVVLAFWSSQPRHFLFEEFLDDRQAKSNRQR
jgi:hypothetical protein